ncbi:hypothetical protein F4776DRAFT_649083 [Hypoxylon sp. NC0597]|nr:hypothetical protein F4776DRAFT_649083 [Hypoxylon sp. NC0597]
MDLRDFHDWTGQSGPQGVRFTTCPETSDFSLPVTSMPSTASVTPGNLGTYTNWRPGINMGSRRPYTYNQGSYDHSSYNQNTHYQNSYIQNTYVKNPYYPNPNYQFGHNGSIPLDLPRPSNTVEYPFQSQPPNERPEQRQLLAHGAPVPHVFPNVNKEVQPIKKASLGLRKRRRPERPPVEEVKVNLTAPLSELAKDLTDVHDLDVVAHVYRGAEQRRQEAARYGRVRKTSSSFLLYRVAYTKRIQELIKRQVLETHGKTGLGAHLSRIAGKSWRMEPQEVRDQFEKWANIDKENHILAFQDYQ